MTGRPAGRPRIRTESCSGACGRAKTIGTTCTALRARVRFVAWLVARGCAPGHAWALWRLGFTPRQAVAHWWRSHWVLWRWMND